MNPITQNSKFKILAIVGPTASGKSELAVALAKKYKGEIISCDSRQIYKGMDVGTGKVEGSWKTVSTTFQPGKSRTKGYAAEKKVYKTRGREKSVPVYVYKNIPHHCIDFVNPKKQFSVTEFQVCANKAMQEIEKRGHIAILCGGTGHWVDAVAYNQTIPEVKPNPKMRKDLEKFSNEQLLERLKMLDPDRASFIDWHNKRRLVRALEIVLTTGKPVPKMNTANAGAHEVLWIGLNPEQKTLYKKINKRLTERLQAGMITEVSKLRLSGLSWKRLESFGLEYKFISLYLQKKLSRQAMTEQLAVAIQHYAKRQMTWFKKNQAIHWVHTKREGETLTKTFLK